MGNSGTNHKPRVCMIVQQRDVKGGIASVTEGYYGSSLEDKYDIRYVESYCDGSQLKKLVKVLKGLAQFGRILNGFKPELVHMHTSFGPSFYRLQPFLYLAKRHGIPVVDHCHGADFDEFYVNASEKKKRAVRRVFSKFDKIIVLSQEWHQKFSGVVPDDKLVVIHNYCKPKGSEQLEGWMDDRFAGKQVAFLGELGKRKGGFDFADIIKATASKIPDVKFVLCGDGAKEDVEKIKADIAKKCSGIDVSFPGWVRDSMKDKILVESAVFLLPSYQEGQPMSILDAMAYGLPVVSTEVGGIPQQVKNGVNGYLTKPGDTGACAEGIAALLSDREKYYEAARQSLKVATEKYGFETHIAGLSEVYDSVLIR